jgi:hypothetical protein
VHVILARQTGLSVYDFTRGENRTGYFGGPFLEPSEQPARPHAFDTQNAKDLAGFISHPGPGVTGITTPRSMTVKPTIATARRLACRMVFPYWLRLCLAIVLPVIRFVYQKKKRPPAARRVLALILDRANCHTRMADRYTVLCPCYRREDDPEITATTGAPAQN